MADESVRRVVVRPFAWSAVICTALCVFVARPAAADPVPPPGVPDAGSRPAVVGSVQLPTGSTPGGLPATTQPVAMTPGPLGQEIMTKSAALETLGQQLLQMDASIAEAKRSADSAHDGWTKAANQLSDLRDQVGHEAGEAYKAATALGPLSGLASDLHELSVLAPGLGQQPGGEATAHDVDRAEQSERAAFTAYQAATASLDELTRQRDSTKADFDRRNAELTDLRTRNSVAYQRELAAIDAQQASIGAGLNVGGAVGGMTAGTIAQQAVAFAKSKLGRPYVWGAEGPDYFDCSGLVLWSYQQAGYNQLPRVADDQYAATAGRTVTVDKLLPGDLLFFATDKSNWRTVHHVAMYVGNGYMIHAPSTGDVVKISPIWWSEFYRATRVVDAVTAPPTPAPTPGPSKSTPPSPPLPRPSSSSPSRPPSTPPPSSPATPSDPPTSTTPPPSEQPSSSQPSTGASSNTSAGPSAGASTSAVPSASGS
jgi:peptidoglycan DL-endopeptidase CwlO